MDSLIGTLEEQIDFETERDTDSLWTKDYKKGYIDGLRQAVEIAREN